MGTSEVQNERGRKIFKVSMMGVGGLAGRGRVGKILGL